MTQERQQRRTSTLFQEPVHMLVMHEVSNQSVIKDVRESETVCTSHYSQFELQTETIFTNQPCPCQNIYAVSWYRLCDRLSLKGREVVGKKT
jgi:hypothetical protein